jgi:hypothetical protein
MGAPNVSQYFNTKSFINVVDFKNMDDCIHRILEIDQNDALYHRMQQEPFFKDNIDFSYLYGGQFFKTLAKLLPKELSEFIRPCQLYPENFLFVSTNKAAVSAAKKSRFFTQCRLISQQNMFNEIIEMNNTIITYCSIQFNPCAYKQIHKYFKLIQSKPFVLFKNDANEIDCRFFLCRDNYLTRHILDQNIQFKHLDPELYVLSTDFHDRCSPFYT